MPSQKSLVDNGTNKFAVFCTRCPSKILNSGMAKYCDNTHMLPFMQQKGEGKTEGEEIKGYWQVSEIYTFENVGFSNTVENLKYLICADCEIGPIGFHDLSTKQSYVALARVKHSQY